MSTLRVTYKHFGHRAYELELDEKGTITKIRGYTLPPEMVIVAIDTKSDGSIILSLNASLDTSKTDWSFPRILDHLYTVADSQTGRN